MSLLVIEFVCTGVWSTCIMYYRTRSTNNITSLSKQLQLLRNKSLKTLSNYSTTRIFSYANVNQSNGHVKIAERCH
ncbi:hypothetical protein GQ44DRAFT_712870, partial [Phaeosphaeriaceae sp. PMI808]